jgi:hypothetical protein
MATLPATGIPVFHGSRARLVAFAASRALFLRAPSRPDKSPLGWLLKNGTGSEPDGATVEKRPCRAVPVPIFQRAARSGSSSRAFGPRARVPGAFGKLVRTGILGTTRPTNPLRNCPIVFVERRPRAAGPLDLRSRQSRGNVRDLSVTRLWRYTFDKPGRRGLGI